MSKNLFLVFVDSSEWSDDFYIVKERSEDAALSKAYFKYKEGEGGTEMVVGDTKPYEIVLDANGVSQLFINAR